MQPLLRGRRRSSDRRAWSRSATCRSSRRCRCARSCPIVAQPARTGAMIRPLRGPLHPLLVHVPHRRRGPARARPQRGHVLALHAAGGLRHHAGLACVEHLGPPRGPLRRARTIPPTPNVVIVGIDDESVQTIGHYPVPRDVYAQRARRTSRRPARRWSRSTSASPTRATRRRRAFADGPDGQHDPGHPRVRRRAAPIRATARSSRRGVSTRSRSSSSAAPTPKRRPERALPAAVPERHPRLDRRRPDADGVRAPDPDVRPAGLLRRGHVRHAGDQHLRLRRLPRASLVHGLRTGPTSRSRTDTATFGTAWKSRCRSTTPARRSINFFGPPGNYQGKHQYVSFGDVLDGKRLARHVQGQDRPDRRLRPDRRQRPAARAPRAPARRTAAPMAGVEMHANVVADAALPSRIRSSSPPSHRWCVFLIILVLAAWLMAVAVARLSVLWGLLGTVRRARRLHVRRWRPCRPTAASCPTCSIRGSPSRSTYTGVTAYRFLYEDREKRKVTRSVRPLPEARDRRRSWPRRAAASTTSCAAASAATSRCCSSTSAASPRCRSRWRPTT